MNESVFRNARIVLADAVQRGELVVRDGVIADIGDRGSRDTGIDFDGDWLLPGLVELHTDHLEVHYAPRPGVRWNPAIAVQGHDAQIAASGITTVFDALRVGMDEDSTLTAADMRQLGDAIAESQTRCRLRAEHFIHLRCEVSAPDVMDGFFRFAEDRQLRMVSLMDHTPGQRQFTSLDAYRAYYQSKTGMSDQVFRAFVNRRLEEAGRWSPAHRKALSDACRQRGIVLASHDDATRAHVNEAAGNGVTVAEFPTTVEAAVASREAGMKVLMGAPNVVRGGSHSGNVAAADLAGAGLLDILSSDYIPLSLIQSVFMLAADGEDRALPRAVAMVSANPAAAAGLDDRGTIAPGMRADLIRVRLDQGIPVVRAVWREGQRVA